MIEIPADNQQLSSQQTLEMLQFYFETIISEYTAFNHAQIVYPLYQTFLVQLNQQLRTLEQSNIGDIAINQTYQNLKDLQKKAADDLIIQEMLFEYDEFIHPIQIQALPKLINQKQKQPQKQKKAVSCILNENCDKQEYLQVGSQSVLIHHNKDKIQSFSELDDHKLNVIKEFDEKSYFSQINFERNPLSDLKAVTEQRLTQSKNYYYNEAQLDDAYYVIQQAKIELQDNELLLNWFYETYGDYVNMIQDKMNTMQINLNELESSGWIIEKNTKTLIIKYKIDSKNSTVTLFMDSVFEANVTKLMALINEIELYQNYVPFCVRSSMPKRIGKCCKICDIQVYFPLISDRKAVFVGEGIDRLNINGTIVFICKSIDNDPEFLKIHNIDISKDKGKFVNLILNYYVFELTPISENKCRVRAVTNSDPQCRYIPKALVALVARKMASTLFEKMQKITQNFVKSPWYPKYVENQEFYDWIDNKVQIYFSKQKQL
ncbi:unnamed protein product [Paramecium pentaurelia]|uniref:START domain-containing protein n=1 Tax=Paramecium pentaurelia TaxID=43138 RepID=A0A8S1TUV1_9CILI|nr:unnamed protein product [Paramecium pentaurelia]